MTTTLRDFIAQRDAEIRDQLKLLRAEQKELQVAKAALDGEAGISAAPTAGTTIKDLAREVLGGAPDGYTSGEILNAIKTKYGREIDRTSLSPQLSRLKESGEVVLQGQKWFLTALHAAWETHILEQAAEAFRGLEEELKGDAEVALGFDDL